MQIYRFLSFLDQVISFSNFIGIRFLCLYEHGFINSSLQFPVVLKHSFQQGQHFPHLLSDDKNNNSHNNKNGKDHSNIFNNINFRVQSFKTTLELQNR